MKTSTTSIEFAVSKNSTQENSKLKEAIKFDIELMNQMKENMLKMAGKLHRLALHSTSFTYEFIEIGPDKQKLLKHIKQCRSRFTDIREKMIIGEETNYL